MTPKSLMSLFVIGIVLALSNQVNAAGIDDNEIEEYEEPVSTFNQNTLKIYYDYNNTCGSHGGACTNSEACEEPLDKTQDLCPQRNSNVICCKKMNRPAEICAHSHNKCLLKEQCHNAPTKHSDDCPAKMTCCVLVV